MTLRVITYNLPVSSPNHTGVATATPFFRNVVREMYFWPRMAGGIGLTVSGMLRPRSKVATHGNRFRAAVAHGSSSGQAIDPALSSVLKALHA